MSDKYHDDIVNEERFVSFHVDIDSPKKLLKFWGASAENYTIKELDSFYVTAMTRALELFDKQGVKATFFCVGDELECSAGAKQMIKEAFLAGHEIANHTYSHPYGLGDMNEGGIRDEIERCSGLIKDITGSRPAGFRSPGYDMNNKILSMLEGSGFIYDSSAFWSILNVAARLYHKLSSKNKETESGFRGSSFLAPTECYFPSKEDWKKRGSYRTIVEVPLTRTGILNLPFYSNFHLMTPEFYRHFVTTVTRRRYMTYLMHLIEFVDFDDGIPKALKPHPNISMGVGRKVKTLETIIQNIKRNHASIRTDKFIQIFRTKRRLYA